MKANCYVRAKSLDEAYSLLNANPLNKILGGGLWLKKGNAQIETLIDLADLGLDKVEDKGDFVEVGSLVSLRELELNPLIKGIAHGLISNAASKVMGPAFRNIATIGGTIVGRFAFSDVLTALLIKDVTLVFYKGGEVSLEEFLSSFNPVKDILVKVKISKCECKSFFKKCVITSLDYPLVNIAVAKGKYGYRIAVGSRPAVASLAKEAMEYLSKGGDDFEKAAELAVNSLKFGDSTAIKADYRKQLVKTYVRRGLEEVNQ